MAANQFLKRKAIADYLNTSATSTPTYSLMGFGFNTLDESPNAQTDENTFINDEASTTTVKGYKPQFAFDSYLIKSEVAVMNLYKVGRDHLTGGDAERDYVRVDIYDPIDGEANTFKARKFVVSVEVSKFGGGGGENISVSGNLNNVGTMIQGKFNTTTKVFTQVDTVDIALSTSIPAADATAAVRTANIVLTFNNKIVDDDIKIYNSPLGTEVTAITKAWDATGKILTITPTTALAATSRHALVIFGVVDENGQELASVIRYFTTGA